MLQGVNSIGSHYASAANSFSGSTVNINNTCANYVSYYCQLPGTIGMYPTHTGHVTVFYTPSGNTCAQTYITGGSGGAGGAPGALVRVDQTALRAYEAAFLASKEMMCDSIRSEFSLIDFGKHDSLINYIDTVTDAGALYATLVAGSPYLSSLAVEAAATTGLPVLGPLGLGGTPLLSDTQMVAVLELNPDLLRNPNILYYVDSIYSFCNHTLHVLHHYAEDSVTARTVTEDSIESYRMTMANAEQIILLDINAAGDTSVSVTDTTGAGICTDSTSMYYTLDSNTVYSNSYSVDTWLRHVGGLWADYARVGYYNALQQYDVADSVFYSIPETWLAIDSENVIANSAIGPIVPVWGVRTGIEIASMTNIWGVLYNAETSGSNINPARNIYSLDSTDIAALDTSSAPIAPANTAEILTNNLTNIINPSISSGSILVIKCLEVIPELGRRESGGGSGGQQSQMGDIMPYLSKKGGEQFSAFPNPASGIVTFAYNVPDAGGDVRIVITNVVGEEEATLHTGNNSGAVQWNPNGLAPGMYIYQASGANGIIYTGKIVVAK